MEEENSIQIRMYIEEDGSTGTYDVVKKGTYLYELQDNDPFNELLTYKTVIEVYPKMKEEEIYEFKGVFKASAYSLEVYGLPSVLNETELRRIGQKIVDEGGFWEVLFGGMGYVNLPKTSTLDVNEALNTLIKAKQ